MAKGSFMSQLPIVNIFRSVTKVVTVKYNSMKLSNCKTLFKGSTMYRVLHFRWFYGVQRKR